MNNAVVAIMSPELARKLGAVPAPREPTFGCAMFDPSREMFVWATDGSKMVWKLVPGCRQMS
jgi:hypothetical protein